MRRFYSVLFILSFVIITYSCKEWGLSCCLTEFMNKTIVVPDSFHVIQNGKVYQYKKNELQLPTLIVYVDENSCNTCKINNLDDYKPIFELAVVNQTFNLMIIFSPNVKNYNIIKRELMMSHFEYPIYLDQSQDFKKLNACNIPLDRGINSFLIDKECRPIYVGDPVKSGRLKNLFLQILDTLNNY